MAYPAIIDALFCIPRSGTAIQISDCIPFRQDLTLQMNSNEIAGAVVAPCNCALCQHLWNCADRLTHEVRDVVAQNPKQLRGLATYDLLQIGDSLRWIDEAVAEGGLVGAYALTENCVSGLDTPRMYPLYGICSKLRVPVVLDFTSRERWIHHRPQVEVVAADFPELDILLATPPGTDSASILQLMQRFPRISFLLCPQELHLNAALCDYVELDGRDRAVFRSSSKGWLAAVEAARTLPLGPAAQRAYLSENAAQLFSFPAELLIPKA
jgi:predicted TIM-barrel fold metal-dependent hydrolase